MNGVDNSGRKTHRKVTEIFVHKLGMLHRDCVVCTSGSDLHLLRMLPLVLTRASISTLPSGIIPFPALPLLHFTPMWVSGVVPNLVGTKNKPTPGTPSSCPIVVALLVNGASSFGGGVEVIANHVGSNKSVTPTPTALPALGLVGKGGVDVHAEREAAVTSGTPTPPFGTPPLTFVVRVSAAGSHPAPLSFLVGELAPCFLLPVRPPPPSSHKPPPPALWDDASAEAGKQGVPVATRAGSLAPLFRSDL